MDSGFAENSEGVRAMPLIAWSDKQKASVAQRVLRDHADWCTRWGVSLPDKVIVRDAAVPARPEEGAHLDVSPQDVKEAIHAALFAEDPQRIVSIDNPGAIAQRVVYQACEAWYEIVGDRLSVKVIRHSPGSTAASFHALDGRLSVAIPIGPRVLDFTVEPEQVQSWLSQAPEIAAAATVPSTGDRPQSVLHALDEQSVRLSVYLEPITLTLGELNTLQLGDVIPLRHALADPPTIELQAGIPLGHAWLGQSEGNVAIRLQVPPAQTSAAPLSATPYSPAPR